MTEFLVFNETDGIPAFCEPFATLADAEKAVAEFPKRFAAQGYYLTARRERIDPRDVELTIEEVE